MMEAAKDCANNPGSRQKAQQDRLMAAVTELAGVSQDTVLGINRRALFHQLEAAARTAARDAALCVEANNAGKEFNKNKAAKAEMAKVCSRLTETTAALQRAVQFSESNPVSAQVQTNLLERAEEFAVGAAEMLNKSKKAINQIDNKEARDKLQSSNKNLEKSLKELFNQMKRTEAAAETVRYEATKELLASLDPELNEMGSVLNSFNHKPANKDHLDEFVSDMNSASTAVQNDIFQISKALDSGDLSLIQLMIGNLGQNVGALIMAVKDVAGTAEEIEEAKRLISTAKGLLVAATSYVETLNKLKKGGMIDNSLRSEIESTADSLSRETVNINNLGRNISTLEENNLDHLKLSLEEILNNPSLDSSLKNLLNFEQTIQEELKKIKNTHPSEELKGVVREFSESLAGKRGQLIELNESGKHSKAEVGAASQALAIELFEVTEYIAELKAFRRLASKAENTILAGNNCNQQLENNAQMESVVGSLKETISHVSASLKKFHDRPTSSIAKAELLAEVNDLINTGNTLVSTGRASLNKCPESLETLAEALAALSKEKKKAEEAGPLLEIDAAEELLSSLQAEFDDFKNTSKTVGKKSLGIREIEKARAEVVGSAAEINKTAGKFLSSALESNKKNMKAGAAELGQNMTHFVKAAMISAQDEDKSGGGKKLIDNTDSAIKNARNVMMIAKERFYHLLHTHFINLFISDERVSKFSYIHPY